MSNLGKIRIFLFTQYGDSLQLYCFTGIFGLTQRRSTTIAHHRRGNSCDIGAVLDQLGYHKGMALIGGLHQGGGATLGFTGVHIGAVFQQHVHSIKMAGAGR